MPKTLKDFYNKRQGTYIKNQNDENFLENFNSILYEQEQSEYQDIPIRYPLIFVIGLPRSGTTLMTQLIAHSFKTGYINNFVARFYKAPVYGIRLSRILFGEADGISFRSDYARTAGMTDLHEFGYFWRYWLRKEQVEGITNAPEAEKMIDWPGLRKTLANIQKEFDAPLVFKNIFGSYHMEKLNEILQKVIFVYIKRDILDSAVSILQARKKYYTDLNTWWSYMPVEYNIIKDMDYWHQIAGQVFYLKRYYDTKAANLNNVIEIDYPNLVRNPGKVLEKINACAKKLFDYTFEICQKPPQDFSFSTHSHLREEKEKFRHLIAEFSKREKNGENKWD